MAQLKLSLFMLILACVLTLIKKLMIKNINLKLVILLEHQNRKTILQKAIFQIGLKKFWRLKKLKALCRGHMSLVNLTKM